ncbi:MFS transporter [Actinotalea sp. BY-33]|uniref:MFS transporter n=1 Tax=Actinotalea soli TaxID=2819234 RepID=A0A939RWH8_9CELL|nr:MFS transporter [Actinotalea soli]MBO1752201.1 MFS transporter [Actinotalea soli]
MTSPAARPASPGRRTLALGVFLPVVVFETGLGAILPVVALTAVDLGADVATAGVVVALLAVGQILGDVPAGAIAARFGDRRAMLGASIAAVVALTAAALAPSVVVLGLSLLALGAINAVFMLARHSYLTETTPVMRRARMLSTLGGLQRVGTFIGPFVGAGVIHLSGLRGVYWLAVGTSVVTAVIVALVPDVDHRRPAGPRVPTWHVLRDHRQVLWTLGLGVLMVGAVRGSRQIVLPLWSEHLGLAPATTSIVFGIAGAVDMLLFYPAGRLMDRRGRLWTAIPSMLVLGAGFVALPFTTGFGSITVVAMVIGLGNGMGAGILMTLGADVAPPTSRAQFLGLWRLCQDAGGAAGPLLVAGGAALGSLAAGIWVVGGVGVASAGVLARWAPRWSVHASGATRRRAREAGLLD